MNTLIKEIKQVNKEGVVLVLTRAASLNGGIKSLEWFVSWDKIEKALFGEQASVED